MDSVSVGRLEIHLKGVSPEIARSAAAGLGNEVLGRLSEQPGSLREQTPKSLDRIDLGKLETARGVGSSDLRRAIADRVAGSIGDSRGGRR